MSAPDEMVEAVAQALWEHDGPFLRWEQLTEPLKETSRERARAVLSVPALAEVIARDAKVREIADAAERLRAGGVSWEGISAAQDAYKRIVAIHLGQSTEPTT